jgi:membrane protein required for colicin V production
LAIDIITAIVAGYGFYLGFTKGIVQTLFNIVAILFGTMAAIKLAPATSKFLETILNSHSPMMWLAGVVVSFVLVLFIMRMLAKGITSILQSANINIVNQLMGGIFMGGTLTVLLSVFVWFANEARLIDESTKISSMTYPLLEPLPSKAKTVALIFRPAAEDFWNQSLDMMDKLKTTVEKSETDASIYKIQEDEYTAPPDSLTR